MNGTNENKIYPSVASKEQTHLKIKDRHHLKEKDKKNIPCKWT